MRRASSRIKFLSYSITYKLNYRHLLAALLFLALAIVTLRTFLFGESLFIHRDLVWPSNTDSLIAEIWYAFDRFDIEGPRRIIYLGPFFALFQILEVSALTAEKLMFLFFRFMTGFFVYFAMYKFLTTKFGSSSKERIFLTSIFAGFFYSFNPIAASMISPTLGFAFSYLMIPLVFYYFDKTLNERNMKNVIITGLLITLALASTAQFLVLLSTLILFPWLVVVCLQRPRQEIFPILRTFGLIAIFSLLFSFYWVLPSVLTILEGVTLTPAYVLTETTLDIFSRQTTFLNIFRLLGDWLPRVELQPIIDQWYWTVLTFAIPIVMILSIILTRNLKTGFYVTSLSALTLFAIFFHKGSQPPFPDFYISLYDIFAVGWMFRIPSKVAMFLSFFVMMIISLAFYSILPSRKRDLTISQLKYMPIPAVVVISISIISWPLFTGDLGGVYRDEDKFQQSTYSEEDAAAIIDTSNHNIVLSGPISQSTSIHQLDPVEGLNRSSIVLADSDLNTLSLVSPQSIDELFLRDRQSLLMQFLSPDAVVVEPFDATKAHRPDAVWSRAATHDPLHGPFHRYLTEEFNIVNSDLDFGKGLIFTWGEDRLDIPVDIKDDTHTSYEIYIRYMKNAQGGIVNIYLDNTPISTINTKDELNEFVWKSLGKIEPGAGQHTLSVENENGLNAINLITFVPSDQIAAITDRMNSMVMATRNVFQFEAEDDFYSDKVRTVVREEDDGLALYMTPNSEIFRQLDITKPSNYTVAVKAQTCRDCSPVQITIGNTTTTAALPKDLSFLGNNNAEYNWLYSSTPVTLNSGNANMTIATGWVSIDKIVLYSDSHQNETIPMLLAHEPTSRILNFDKKIDQTKYSLSIDSTEPFILELSRPYNQFWRAFVSDFEYKPVQLDNGANGFIIDQAGKLDVRVEYIQQSWFLIGLTVSVLSFLLALSYLMIRYRSKKKNVGIPTKILRQQDFGISLSNTGTRGKSVSTTRSVLHKVFSPTLPTSIALVLLLLVLFLLNQDRTSTANIVMVYLYFILVIGVIWQFVLFVKKMQGRGINQSKRT
jgi:hypothetical protein